MGWQRDPTAERGFEGMSVGSEDEGEDRGGGEDRGEDADEVRMWVGMVEAACGHMCV